ncbi:MAG: hypothetical protein ACKO3K_15165 [Cuspidothrix sp.]
MGSWRNLNLAISVITTKIIKLIDNSDRLKPSLYTPIPNTQQSMS